jgi:hypothetical protein
VSPQRRGSKRGSDWKPPRDRREIALAVVASLSVIVVTLALIWFLRPNRDSGSSTTTDTVATTAPSASTVPTTVPTTDTGTTDTTAPATTSTP